MKLLIVTLVALSGCSTTQTSQTAAHVSSSVRDGGTTGVVSQLTGVDVDLSNALAPYNHHSFVDKLLLEMAIAQMRREELNHCLVEDGFSPVPLSPLPARDDPLLTSNLEFPDWEKLARVGFVQASASGPAPGEPQEAPPDVDAMNVCDDRLQRNGSPSEELFAAFAIVSSGWSDVLAEIDGLAEVRLLVDEFGACLRAEGIPVEYTDSEVGFLGYVDSLIVAADDSTRTPVINEEMGKLYAECGQELFETREQLRSGERRTAFLREHDAAISEMNNLIYGSGSR